MSGGHFFNANWLLQYLSNPVQASWSELLCGDSGKTLVLWRLGFRVLKDYRNLNLLFTWVFILWKGSSEMFSYKYYLSKLFTGLTQVTLRAEITKKQSVRVKMACWRWEIGFIYTYMYIYFSLGKRSTGFRQRKGMTYADNKTCTKSKIICQTEQADTMVKSCFCCWWFAVLSLDLNPSNHLLICGNCVILSFVTHWNISK